MHLSLELQNLITTSKTNENDENHLNETFTHNIVSKSAHIKPTNYDLSIIYSIIYYLLIHVKHHLQTCINK